VGRVETVRGPLLETTTHDGRNPGRELVGAAPGRVLPEDRDQGLSRRPLPKGRLPREHLVEDGPEREDVRALVGGQPLSLLGRHVGNSPEDGAGRGLLRGGRRGRGGGFDEQGRLKLGETEIEDLHVATSGHEEVLRLEVPVNDSLRVGGRQPVRDLNRVADRLDRGQVAFLNSLAKRRALEELVHHEGSFVVGAHVEHRQHVRMAEGAGGTGFLLEAPQALRVVHARVGQNLDRHVAAQARVAGTVDLAHAPGPEGSDDRIGPEPGSCEQGQAEPPFRSGDSSRLGRPDQA
jgi:hypothetical protein